MPTDAVMVIRLAKAPDWGEPNRWRRDLLTEFDPEAFNYNGPLCIIRIPEYWGPMVNDGSTWFDVGVSRAYYGKGYERGDVAFFVRVAEWLENRIVGCQVWYGHDADDESLAPFGRADREALLSYFREVGHEPYDSQFRKADGN